ncbi:hypothetical protein CDAR_274661 [Caerostris darwini]|uniref:Uncharacterized protein n=1 Tax=Caerostris darwini TaxID=1538125 RepID=A0AAV4QHJ1_9ARAC|nr:hypothetical protein CDAR_274661 [Caerostris darwini]
MSDPEKLKVGEIFVAAGAAFTKMAELITSLQKVGEASTSSGKWSLQEIQMLQSAVKPFIAELRRIQSTVQSHNDEVISSVRDATDFIDLKESSTESDKKPSNDKEMALNTAVSLPPKRNLTSCPTFNIICDT